MRVAITAVGVLATDAPGEIDGFRGRDHVAVRKHVKLMNRAVQLGIAGIRKALEARPGWEAVAPERRGLFVGSTPAGSEVDPLLPAIEAASTGGRFDVAAFGDRGIPLVHPLWLVKGLSNNVLGYASAYHDIRGVNGNRCDGRASGIAALVDGARAIHEGHADLVVAGGSDSLVGASQWLGVPTGEASVFLVLERGDGLAYITDVGTRFDPSVPHTPVGERGEVGAATGLVELAHRIGTEGGQSVQQVAAGDGTIAWVTLE